MNSASRHSEEVTRNVATVRRTWEAFRSGELAPVLETIDRGVVMDTADLGVPGLGQYYGHRGVRQFWLDWFEVVGDVHTEVLENAAAGDKVVSICHQRASGMASGAEVTWTFAIIFTMRDGKAVRGDVTRDLDEARRVAGLPAAATEQA